MTKKPPNRESFMTALLAARLHDPFGFLGAHCDSAVWHLRLFLPYASRVEAWVGGWVELSRTEPQGLFEWHGKSVPELPCRLRVEQDEVIHETWDPYSFLPLLTEHDLHLFNEGRLLEAYNSLGAHCVTAQGVPGVRFAVWAPNAERVSVVGHFNHWDGRHHPMRARGSSGVWELFLPGMAPDTLYRFELRQRGTGTIYTKSDPYGCAFERRPSSSSRVVAPSGFKWEDQLWMQARSQQDWLHLPLNIYELHLGSWRNSATPDGFLNYREIADQLIPYVREMGYTHVEILPVGEHPLDESWGYQITGYFGVTSRHGTPDDFRAFVDRCHRAGIGIVLDWVPGHFPKDDFALARFDGTALYEHEDPRLGEHQDWGTLIFNYGRNEVRGFLLSNAHFWLEQFHIDGLRVDAVASMLYLDYSRKAGEWVPNRYGGRENLEAMAFLRDFNWMVHERFPGVVTIAEESTAWPMVSRPIYLGGLGFSMKWNMGWMNDTLRYFARDPIFRRHHQQDLTFGQLYAYSENFVLPFSHDEVVHGKRSLLDKMPGDAWQRFANLRLLLTYQMMVPGKKLNFMGNEFGQGREWNIKSGLDWALLTVPWHQGIQRLSRDLNWLYRSNSALHELDFEANGFYWIDCEDTDQSVLSFIRQDRTGHRVLVVLNFTPLTLQGYRVGSPAGGSWRELFNSDSHFYGGSNQGNGSRVEATTTAWNGQPHSLILTLPPLAGIVLEESIP